MNDITIPAPDGAASIARIGSVLGEAGISLEGGGMWGSVAHYLIADGAAAARALADEGIDAEVRDVLVVPLNSDVLGELGRMMLALDRAGVRLDAQYSDHDNRKVFVVDDVRAAREALS